MARRGENIYLRKDGRWEGRYRKGQKPDGSPKYASVYGQKYGEVREKLILLKAEHTSKNDAVISFYGSVWDFISYWLEVLEKPHIKPSTYSSYRNKMENHVKDSLGTRRLDKLKQDDIQRFVEELIRKGLSSNSIKTIFRIFSSAIKAAVDRRFILTDPCRNVVIPAVHKRDRRALTIHEQKQIEKELLQGKGNEAVLIALYTGMRIGEISGLRWEDIDFENDIIHVRHTLQRVSGYDSADQKSRIMIDIPKTDTSYRDIPLTGFLKDYLSSVKMTASSEYVVSCKNKYAEPRVISYRFKRILSRVGIENIAFHQLRHTFATRCIEKQADVVTLSYLLGHASTKMTLDVYAHSTMEQRRTVMLSLNPQKSGKLVINSNKN